MNTCVYDKTDKGREEIATRKYQVPPKLRTLLVMIDGRNPLDTLLKNFAGLGLTEANVKELLEAQYIALVSGGQAPAPVPVAARPPASARARMAARRTSSTAPRNSADNDDSVAVHEAAHAAGPVPGHAAAAPGPAPLVVAMDDADRFRTLYEFFNQTVKSTLGLRGFVLQLKVEKCASLDDFRMLRLPYLEAVLKAKGREMALSLRDRLDQLLGGKPDHDDFLLPGA